MIPVTEPATESLFQELLQRRVFSKQQIEELKALGIDETWDYHRPSGSFRRRQEEYRA